MTNVELPLNFDRSITKPIHLSMQCNAFADWTKSNIFRNPLAPVDNIFLYSLIKKSMSIYHSLFKMENSVIYL